MRYLLAIAECGSISVAAQRLFIAQSSLSQALREAERETGIRFFQRSNKGVELTPTGRELLSYVSQVVQQDDLLQSRYRSGAADSQERFSVSAQHYSFGVDAFTQLIGEYGSSTYAFAYRETTTEEVIDDVSQLRSDLGILCLTSFNAQVLKRKIDAADLAFQPLFEAKPRLLVADGHPLAGRSIIDATELSPFPRIVFEQGASDSLYYAEEPLPDAPRSSLISVRDRSTMASILAHTDAYTIATGFRSEGMDFGVVSRALRTTERMAIGYLSSIRGSLGEPAGRFIEILQDLPRPL